VSARLDGADTEVRFDRFDVARLASPVRHDNGWMDVEGVLTKTGVFTYVNPDGSLRREARIPEEVFAPASLASAAQVPVTDDHPPTRYPGKPHLNGLLDASNARDYAVGSAAEPRRDGEDKLVGKLRVTDGPTASKMTAGKVALSCGYTCVSDRTPGVFEGQPYDLIQRNIRYNHVALVDVGRAGPEARVRVDGIDTRVEHASPMPGHLPTGQTAVTMTGPGEHDMTKEEIEKIQAALAAAVARADRAEGETKTVTARAEAAEGKAAGLEVEVGKLRAGRTDAAETDTLRGKVLDLTAQLEAAISARKDAEDPARFAKAVQERAALESAAKRILGEAFSSARTDREIRIQVLQHCQGSADVNRSDDYIRARFDSAVEAWDAGAAAVDALNVATRRATAAENQTREDAVRTDNLSPRDRMILENRTLKPLTGAK
jgi:hypothetical protein